MKFALALAALAGTAVALPKAQGVTEDLSPTASAPAGCQPTCEYDPQYLLPAR